MFAVLAPGLGERLELDVHRHPPETAEVVAYRVELGKIECERPPPFPGFRVEDPLFSYAREIRIGKVEVDGCGRREAVEVDEGRDRIHPHLAVLLAAFYVDTVDERISEGVGKSLQGFRGQVACGKVELRREDRLPFAEPEPEVFLDGLARRRPDVIGDPGQETDLDSIVEVGLCRPIYGVALDDGVAELRADLREFVRGKVPPAGRYGIDVDEVQLAKGDARRAELLGTRLQAWIAGIVYLYPMDV